ncbi:nitroreductase family protein [Selenomonas noxia]|uniref:nitroreductase family protein n=1 Tax=Selenomonas noxia TaxID=135083 RepID=UPI0028E305E7|nr:nitroreductase family protein [Selenomonas noxia]
MDFEEVLEKRRSIRKFDACSVAEEDVTAVLEARRHAPSGGNLQPWCYVVIKSEQMRARLKETSPLSFFAVTPVILACYDMQAVKKLSERSAELKTAGIFDGVAVDAAQASELREKSAASMRWRRCLLRRLQHGDLACAYGPRHRCARTRHPCWIAMFEKNRMR